MLGLFRQMFIVGVAMMVLTGGAAAEPARLKLSYFASDNSSLYRGGVQPFVEAIRDAGEGEIALDIHLGGEIGDGVLHQLAAVRTGAADIAYVIAGYTPAKLPDHRALELPGLFRNQREAAVIHWRLIESGMMRGLEDVVVLGAYGSTPETIHSRIPVSSLDDLKGARIRVNNEMQARALEKLGIVPVEMPIVQITTALSKGDLDGALVPPAPLVEFGISRVATHHYMLRTSVAPLLLVMNRDRFEALPAQTQRLLRKASGEWLSERNADIIMAFEEQILEKLRTHPARNFVRPSESELARADRAYAAVRGAWAAEDPYNAELLAFIEAQLTAIRGQ